MLFFQREPLLQALAKCRIAQRVIREYHGEALCLVPGTKPLSARQAVDDIGLFEPSEGDRLIEVLDANGLPSGVVVPPSEGNKHRSDPEVIKLRERIYSYILAHQPIRRAGLREPFAYVSSQKIDNALMHLRAHCRVRVIDHHYNIM